MAQVAVEMKDINAFYGAVIAIAEILWGWDGRPKKAG